MTDSTPFPPFRRWLAAKPDGFLADVLRRRPDALTPPPRSSDALAGRLQLRSSVQRALSELDALALAAIEVAMDAGGDAEPVKAADIASELRARLAAAGVPAKDRPTVAHVRAALDELRQSALVHGDGPGGGGTFSGRSSRKKPLPWEDHVMVTDEAAAALPQGWRLLPRADEPATAELREALADTDARQRRLLGTLADAGGLGTTKDAAADADETLPVPRLIAAGLLERVDDSTVRLPARVRALLKGAVVPDGPPALRPGSVPVTGVRGADAASAGAALDLLRQIRALLDATGERPVPLLKDGTIGVREHRRLLDSLSLDEATLSRVLAMAFAAGLVNAGTPRPLPEDDGGGDYLAPTPTADEYLESSAAQRWALLAEAWLASEEAPWLVGEEGPTGKPIALLSPNARRAGLPELRRTVLRLLADVAADDGGATSTTDNDAAGANVRELLSALRPLTATHTPDVVLREVLAELAMLGLVAPGSPADGPTVAAASSAGRAAVALAGAPRAGVDRDGPESEFVEALSSALPAPATKFIVQADSTILIPGPAEGAFLDRIEQFADLESPGLASVYRVSEESVRRSLDQGTSAAELRAFLDDHAMGEVPQSVTYLIEDVARRHGRLRTGPAAGYLRCDDPALLAQVISDPIAVALGLRRVSETVAISQAPPAALVAGLRDSGYSALAEDAMGAALDLSPEPARTPDRPRRPAPAMRADDGRISQALQSIQAGDRAADAGDGTRIDMDDDPATGAAAQALLHRAARSGLDVTIGFVDRNGRAGRRRVRPVTVSGGQVDAVDPATGQVLRFLLHRVTDVVLAD